MKAINLIVDLIEKGQFSDVKLCLPDKEAKVLCGRLEANEDSICWVRSEGGPIDVWTVADAVTQKNGKVYYWYSVVK